MEFYEDDYRAIVAVLDRGTNREDAYAVRRTCHELARLVLWRNATRLKMIEDDLLGKLAPMIAHHVEREADVVVDFCRFMRRCISHKDPTELDIQSKVTEAGFLRVFRCALESHVDRPDVFCEVCRVLTLLCFDMPNAPHADNQLEIVESGLLQLLLDRLRDPDVITQDNAAVACDVVLSIIYENGTTASHAVNDCGVLACLSELLARYLSSSSIIQSTTRTLFQLMTLLPDLELELTELHFVERTLDFLELHRHSCDALLLWHALKFLERAVRCHEPSKDEFCRCRGAVVVIQAIQHTRGAAAGLPPATRPPPELLACLYYVTFMLFCRLAVRGRHDATASVDVAAPRVAQLMVSSAHKFALQILKTLGSEPPAAAEQAVRLLELIASIEANRIPLTRLGASRQIKVVYNSTAHRGLQGLCERAIAAIEGT